MRDILTICKKEIRSAFSDKVILAQIVLVPFIIVFGYAMLMAAMTDGAMTDEDTKFDGYYVNAPAEMESVFKAMGFQETSASEVDSIRKDITAKTKDILLVFPDDFKIDPNADEGSFSDVEMWYNSSSTDSLNASSTVREVLSGFQPVAFTINADTDTKYDLGDENFMMRRFLGTLLPVMLMVGIFSVMMNLAAECIAGDKERGFLNTMLISPVKRSHIAFGKSLFLFVAVTIGGISAFIGLVTSLPRMASIFGAEGSTFSYSAGTYIQLFFVTVTSVFAFAGFLLLISAVSKSVKQATTLSPIVMMVLMLAGMLTMQDSVNKAVEKLGLVNAAIPGWNGINAMKKIVELDCPSEFVLVTCLVNVAFAVICALIIGKMFENEKIVNV